MSKDGSLHTRMSILFQAAEKRIQYLKEASFWPIFSSKLAVYIRYILFLSVRPERKSTKNKQWAEIFNFVRIAYAELKKSPPKTDLALLRLPMTARQIRFAQTPLGSVIGKLRIRSSTGRHARNGRCWQSCNIDFAWLSAKYIGALKWYRKQANIF